MADNITPSPEPASVLFRSEDRKVWVIDLPRTIEESQITSIEAREAAARGYVAAGDESRAKRRRIRPPEMKRRLVSIPPPEQPFHTPEPKNPLVSPASMTVHCNELMTLQRVQNALQLLKEQYGGPWCLSRHIHRKARTGAGDKAPKTGENSVQQGNADAYGSTAPNIGLSDEEMSLLTACFSDKLCSNGSGDEALDPVSPDGSTRTIITLPDGRKFFRPSHSEPFEETITNKFSRLLPLVFPKAFLSFDPTPRLFDLILLDPPWPNRSASRRRAGRDASSSTTYKTASTFDSIACLLRSIPISQLLAPGGTVAIWVTNSALLETWLTSDKSLGSNELRRHLRFHTGPHDRAGLLKWDWGVEIVDVWTWLKVTTSGEPVVELKDGPGVRRPWERLLIARRVTDGEVKGTGGKGEGKERVIVAVPEAHSRKPNLRAMLEEYLGFEPTSADEPPKYRALEVFARNLTAGWWSWGDEVMKYQADEFWCENEECDLLSAYCGEG